LPIDPEGHCTQSDHQQTEQHERERQDARDQGLARVRLQQRVAGLRDHHGVHDELLDGVIGQRRRHRFERTADSALSIQSYSSRKSAYRENPNQSVVLELSCTAQASLELALREPVAQTSTTRLADLFTRSHAMFTGPFPKESCQWHRLVPLAASALEGRCTLDVPAGRSYVYLRARQKNGHVAWASPVFLNYR